MCRSARDCMLEEEINKKGNKGRGRHKTLMHRERLGKGEGGDLRGQVPVILCCSVALQPHLAHLLGDALLAGQVIPQEGGVLGSVNFARPLQGGFQELLGLDALVELLALAPGLEGVHPCLRHKPLPLLAHRAAVHRAPHVDKAHDPGHEVIRVEHLDRCAVVLLLLQGVVAVRAINARHVVNTNGTKHVSSQARGSSLARLTSTELALSCIFFCGLAAALAGEAMMTSSLPAWGRESARGETSATRRKENDRCSRCTRAFEC